MHVSVLAAADVDVHVPDRADLHALPPKKPGRERRMRSVSITARKLAFGTRKPSASALRPSPSR